MIKKQTEHESKDAVKETIARLKANRKQVDPLRLNKNKEHIPSSNTNNAHSTILRKRASKNASSVETGERKNAINRIIKKLLFGEMTQGEALKELRLNVLGIKQDVYADLVKISRKTLSDIENDRGNYKTDILNKVFKPFGLKVGLVPLSFSMLISALNTEIK